VSKCYRYTIAHGVEAPDAELLFERRTTWWTRHRLDVGAMRRAAGVVVGTHDFAAFAAANHGREHTVRTVFGCTVTEPRAGRLVVEVAGSGFLYNMVRIIAGTLVDAGRGKLDGATIARALATGDRALAGPTLPPHGLRLEWVRYGTADEGGAAG
jgi:tRNA pseudouridine38-40 synthase